MKGRKLGPYMVLGEIARGGMAAVYAGEHESLHHQIALKILHAQLRSDRKIRSRFLEEARLLANIRHPHILEVRDILESREMAAIVMELLEGSTLQQYNQSAGLPRPVPEVLGTYLDITRALAAAHERDVVHRDMKPSNIFLHCDDDKVIPKLMDFGIAKLVTQDGEALTRTGALLGTPQYMAPEQFRDSSKVDLRADIFAVGVMMYEAVTGRLPFPGDAVTEVMHKILHEEPQAPTLIAGDVPESVETVIMRCLRKNRDQRFGSVTQLHMALKRLVEELGKEAIPTDHVPRAGWSDFDTSDTAFSSLSAEEFFGGEADGARDEDGGKGTRIESGKLVSVPLPDPEPVISPVDDPAISAAAVAPTMARRTRVTDEDLPGYRISERVYQGSETEVYRGLQLKSRRMVMVKVLAADYPSPDQVARLTHEYEVTKDLDIDGVVRVLGLERFRNSLALITEDFGGESLRELQDGERPDLAETLAVGTRMAVVLDQLHRREVIHKDINPKNIVRNPTTGEVKLIDFGLAMVQRGRQQAMSVSSSLEGTLAYISPEQTGRMNRAVDYRSDYYSLGVTLYEMLTGRLPFETTDRAELVHCHIARTARPPSELDPSVPGIVSDLVMRLMSKNAENRYQSARGLRADLEECRNQLREAGVIAEFPLGRHDVSDRFQIPEKLYGRDEQVAVLMEAFKRIRLERLLESMLRIVIENGGAEKGVLLLEEKDRLVVQAEARVDRDEVEVLQEIPLRDREDLAQSVVNYVMRTRETVVLDDAARAGSFARDTYVLKEQPRSILCTPLLHQGKLAGILYLENNLSPGAFTPARVEMLKMLSSEIVISLENARLYGALKEYSRGLEQKVRERTKELSRANADLSREKRKADELLLNVLPAKVAEDLKREGRTEPEQFDDVTVFFSDFVDFTRAAEDLEPKELINELNELFTGFDNIVEANGCERIKTIGDAYMFVCGMPAADPAHGPKAVRAAREILAWVEERNTNSDLPWKIRVGLHSGPLWAAWWE